MALRWDGYESQFGPDRRRKRRRALSWCRSCYRRAAAPGSDACPDCQDTFDQWQQEAKHAASHKESGL